jgi:hypothetical protein
MSACEGVDSFPTDGFRVRIPPCHAAFIGAEPLLFRPGCVGERDSALTAENTIGLIYDSHTDAAEVVPAAE